METKDGLYKCTKCLIFQTKNNFHKRKNKFGIKSWCKNCCSDKRIEVYAENKEKELEYCRTYKLNNPEKRKVSANKYAAKNYLWFRSMLNDIKNVPCLDCKRKFSPCAMDFDHRDPANKLFNISEAQSKSEKTLLAEMVKCDLVCANCHRSREYNRRHLKISYLNKIINAYKNFPCMDCNVIYPYYVMDFDHRDPAQKIFNISKPPKQKDKNLIISEIMKCDVVCANCHRIRSFLKQDERHE
jgi:hypothetical protein